MNFAGTRKLVIRPAHRMPVRPRVIINAAMSVDGKIALSDGKAVRLSNDEDMRRVHRLRTEADAILVGVGTVLVEGGSTVIWSFLRHRLADELKVFISSRVLGGRSSPTIAGGQGTSSLENSIRLRLERSERLGDGVLLEYSVVR